MNTSRLEAFSDAVIAIIITIMVLELKIPNGTDWHAFRPLLPVFLAYVMSYVYLGIYWNNHHHMMHATEHVDGKILWANLHLLFWLSLVPFVTGWIDENGFATVPTVAYGTVLLMAAIAYFILSRAIMAHDGANDVLRKAIGTDTKGKISIVFYIIALAFAFENQWIAIGIYVLVAMLWLVPDRRIERTVDHHHD